MATDDDVKALFEAAQQQTADGRVEFVRKAARAQKVRDEVLDLLKYSTRDDALQQESFFARFKLQSGEILADRFHIVCEVGSGGMGDVYEALDMETGERVALKTIKPECILDERFVRYFRSELGLARRVGHRNVCRVHDLETAERAGQRIRFLAMEFLHGETLRVRIRRRCFLAADALPILEQIAAGLEAAHASGVIHRDVKPSNVMLVAEESGVRAVLTDFGIAKATVLRPSDAQTTEVRESPGTPGYMAPEQGEGRATERSDVYSFALLAYAMVVGEDPPKQVDRHKLITALGQRVGARWHAAIAKCTAAPEQRYPTPSQFVKALSSHSVPWVKTALAAAILIICLGATLLITNRRSPGPFLPVPKSIAVLPGTGGAISQPAVQGLIAGLSMQLTRSADLTVYASSLRAGADVSKERAPLELNPRAEQQGDQIALTITVENKTSGARIFRKEYRAPPDKLLDLQAEVFEDLARVLGVSRVPEAPATISAEAQEFYLNGRSALETEKSAGDVQKSINFFKKAIERDGKFSIAWAGLADAYRALYVATKDSTQLVLADNAASNALNYGADRTEVQLALGSLRSEEGKHEEAIGHLNRARTLSPNLDQSYRRLGEAYADWPGHDKNALEAFKTAIDKGPHYWNNYLRLADFYYSASDFERAQQTYKKAVELNSEAPYGYVGLGNSYFGAGNYGEAVKQYREALRRGDLAGESWANLSAAFFYNSNYKEAIVFAKRAVKYEERDGTNWGNLGDAYRADGQTQKAQEAYRRAISLTHETLINHPDDIGSISSIALYKARLGDIPQALVEVKGLSTTDPEVAYTKALVYAISGRDAEALPLIKYYLEKGYSINRVLFEPDFKRLTALPEFGALRH